MGGAHSRRKGAQGERELAGIAREVGFPEAKREAPMQAGHADAGYPDIGGVTGLHLESKRYKKTPVTRFLKELLAKPLPSSDIPVLVWRDDGDARWFAALDVRVLLTLWKELGELREAVHLVAQDSGVKA